MINEEEPIHPLYAYLYVADKFEGLILVNAATLLDGDPRNNFLNRALTYNPDGVLTGANNITIAGNFAYITTDTALVIVDLSTPLQPKIAAQIPLNQPKAVAVQFHYAFVVDADGMKVLDIRELQQKATVRVVEGADVPLKHAHDIYLARTYAYIANGEDGLAIIDIEKPEQPKLDQIIQRRGYDERRPFGKGRDDQRQPLRLCRRRQKRAQSTAADRPRNDAGIRRFQPEAATEADRDVQDKRRGGRPFQKGSTATGPPTKAATRSPFSAAAAPVRSVTTT